MEPKEILKKARVAKGYTQKTFADKIGITQRAYQRYEKGDFPKYKNDTIKDIDDILGTSLGEILYDNKSRPGANSHTYTVDANILLSGQQEDIILMKAAIEVLRERYAEIKYDVKNTPISETLNELDEEIRGRYHMRFDELKSKK